MGRTIFFIGLLIWLFLPGKAISRHIIGGDIYYKCINKDTDRNRATYRITLTMYRDCGSAQGAEYDKQAEIGIYEKLPNGGYRFITAELPPLGPITFIDADASNPCLIVPPNVCVEQASYQLQITLPIISNSYYFAYQRCCRNETISNISTPGEAGAAFTLEITAEAQRTCNNSPTFKNFPPVVICVNDPLKFDHSVFDSEGDSVVYEFCTPLTAGGSDGSENGLRSCGGVKPDPRYCFPPFAEVNFISPLYTPTFPMGGTPPVQINQATGLITGTPTVQGQFVVGVCIKEYRNGILLTDTRRDFQFNVAFCEPKVFAQLKADSVINGTRFVVNSCGNNTIDFTNLSTEERYISSYKWIFNIQGVPQEITSKNARFVFPDTGTYTGKMILNEGTNCSDSATISVNIYPGIHADYGFTYDTCVAGPVIFKDRSVTESGTMTGWRWNFAGSGNSTSKDPSFTFNTPGNKLVNLQVTDINRCKDDTTVILPYFPVPALLIVNPSIVDGCTPVKVCFNNLSKPIDSTYKIVWDFGDGNIGNQISPCHTYLDEGIYSVKLDVTSPIGCHIAKDYPNWISVRQSPEADFSASPEHLTSLQRRAKFEDLSDFSDTREWAFNDKERFLQENLEYTFKDTGLQKIRLIAINNNGCRDTLIKYIDVEPMVTYFMPNAFTPNNDGANQDFHGKGILLGMKDFQMTIWDRWGMKLFSTTNPLIGWNGTLNNEGFPLLPGGVYVYKVTYKTPRDKVVELNGFATLIR